MYEVFSNPVFKWAGITAATLLIFLSIYILSDIQKRETLRKALFFLTITASAQTFYLLFHEHLPALLKDMLIGLPTIVGPLVYFYSQNYVLKNEQTQWSDFLGFAPFLLVFLLPLFPDFYYRDYPILVLMIVVVHWGLFLVFCGLWLNKNRAIIQKLKSFESKWILTFYFLNVVIWLIHSLLYIIGEPFQLLFAGCIFIIAFFLILYYFRFRGHQLISQPKDSKSVSMKTSLPENTHIYLNKLEKLLWDHKIFLDPNLTIPKLADKMQIQPYLLSQIINTHFSQSFPDFINNYRINEAKVLLKDNNLKISSIATDCGFNTLSSFNLAFKKATRKTPSEFRDQIMTD